MAKVDGFKSFVSIDLNDYNALILKNKEQEELSIAQSEEIVELQEQIEVYKTILIDSWKTYLIKNESYQLKNVVEGNNVEYREVKLLGILHDYVKSVSISQIIYKETLEETTQMIVKGEL